MTVWQCKAARAALSWTQQRLAEKAGIHVETVKRFESDEPNTMLSNRNAMQRALQDGGVVFFEHRGMQAIGRMG